MFRTPLEPRGWCASDRAQLIVLSMLSLFVEIMLIRHLSSEIRIFSYFKNLALIGAFLGLGFGYLYKPKVNFLATLGSITFLAVLSHPLTRFSAISDFLNIGDFNIWEAGKAGAETVKVMAGLLMLTVIFFAVICSMVPIGQALSTIFDRSTNRIADYSINVFASILGIWLFALISFFGTPPIIWYLAVFAVTILVWNIPKPLLGAIAVGAAVSALALSPIIRSDEGLTLWSPYQKINFKKFQSVVPDSEGDPMAFEGYRLTTNSTIYLYMLDLSMKNRRSHPEIFKPDNDRYLYYDFPYNFPKKLDNVLILGAGGGNDVAGALRAGAKSVTAVEIDPVIIRLGKEFHPEQPYQSERVRLINNDARNFLRNSDEKFDLIVLGLLDSHTLTSNFSNTNLDSFMYTLESVGDMRDQLTDDGVLALSFQIPYPWLGAKIYKMVDAQFGRPPEVLTVVPQHVVLGTGGTYFLASKDANLIEQRMAADPIFAVFERKTGALLDAMLKTENAEPQTDDWPYLYVQSRAIPTLHRIVSGLLLTIFVVSYGYSFGRPTRSDLHFAALGAGFLLLQVGVISRFALYWGTTWIVSSIIITLILLAILLANGIYLKTAQKPGYPVLYGLVLTSLAALYFIPLESNMVALLYLIPFTFIAYLFATSFDMADSPGRALGFNLLGALAGGLSESISFVTGLSALILVALGFYIISALMVRRSA